MNSISRTNSADSVKEIRLNLSQLKSSASRSSKSSRRSNSSVEDELLKKHHKSQEKIDKKRLNSKSKEMQNLKLIPQINSKSSQIIQKKHNKEIEDFIVKMKKTASKDLIDLKAEPIKPPELTAVKGMFNSRSYLKKDPVAEKINPNTLNIVDKSKFYIKKKNLDAKAAEVRKGEEVMKECTFKPDLTKTRRGKSFESLMNILTPDEKVLNENPRLPAPNPRTSPKKTLSSLIDSQVYSFKEGVNLQMILEKSHPLLSYNKKVSS